MVTTKAKPEHSWPNHQLPLPLEPDSFGRRRRFRIRYMVRMANGGAMRREDAAAEIRKALPKSGFARTLIPTQADVVVYVTAGTFDWEWYGAARQLVVMCNPGDSDHMRRLSELLDDPSEWW